MSELPGWEIDPPEGLNAMQAIVGEVAEMYTSGNPRFRGAYRAFCDDRDRGGDWRLAFLELVVLYGDSRLASEGQQLALARMRQDISLAREQALEEQQ